jgi:hypothetical protein
MRSAAIARSEAKRPSISLKSNRTATIRYRKRLSRQRSCIERVIGYLKIGRAVAAR